MNNIAFDLFANHRAGVFRYGTSLARYICLALQDYPSLSVHFLLDTTTPPPIIESELPYEVQKRVRFIRFDRSGQFLPDLAELRQWLIDNKIDIYYSSNYIVDIQCPVKFMFTIHDLTRILYPSYSYTDTEFIKKYGNHEYEKLKIALTKMKDSTSDFLSESFSFSQFFWTANLYLGKKAEHIFTVSNSVKEDLIRVLNIPTEKISVISGGARDDIFYRRSEQDVVSTLNELDIVRPYCLCVGLRHKHKRLQQLLEGIDRNRSKIPINGKIILVGDNDYQKLVCQNDLSKYIQPIGYVTDEQLACLYTGAEATIITSVGEGFCLPAQESLLCGTNVISSDTQVLRETIGNAGYFYPYRDFDMLFEFIVQALNRELGDKSMLFSKKHSWPLAATQLLDTIFNHILSSH